MAKSTQNKILELFGRSTRASQRWRDVVPKQRCPFAGKKCFKVRKSDPSTSIGTCSVRYGMDQKDIVICPNRLLEGKQIFVDCLHLLTLHEPGNQLHVVSEVSIPGGSVDYVLVSVRDNKVRDFVGIEFQTLDTTGTVRPERQRLLRELGFRVPKRDVASTRSYGMNLKMTAKTILVQLHHKVETLEHVGKRIALVLQNHLLAYLRAEFKFDHVKNVRAGDALQIHSYRLNEDRGRFHLVLDERLSTDAAGVAKCLGVQADTRVELEAIVTALQKKISAHTLFTI